MKLFHPGNKKFVRKTFAAGAGRVFSEQGIDSALDFIADQVERIFPGQDYEMVQTATDSFNFVWRGDRKADKAALASALLAQRREEAAA